MYTRLFHLVLCALLIGPLSVPGSALMHPENCVGGSAVQSSTFASELSPQVADLHRGYLSSNYEDASGLHKYLYAHNNPVNGIDPSGHFTLVGLNVNMAIRVGIAGSAFGAYSSARRGDNILVGAGSGFVVGALFGSVQASAWVTWKGITVLSAFSAFALQQAENDFRAGYYDLATMEAVFAFAPLVIKPSGNFQVTKALPRGTLTPVERLNIFFVRLREAPSSKSPQESLQQIRLILNGVENEFSGVPYSENPGLTWTGRMYPPKSDFVSQSSTGGLVAETKGHLIELGKNGSIKIKVKGSDNVVFEKKGGNE